MVHNPRYGDGVANTSRPQIARAHAQSFTAGSNPNSAPMPNFSGPRRRSQPAASSSHKKSYSPEPEPSFDLMSTSAPSVFSDLSYQMPNLTYDHQQASLSIAPAAPTYNMTGLPATSFPDSFDSSSEQYLARGIPAFDPAPSSFIATDFAAIGGSDTSFSRPALAPASAQLNSPFTSNGPILAPPVSASHAPTTDSMHKNSPQTPRKMIRPRSAAAARNPPLLPAPGGPKTPSRPLGQRDPNARAAKRHLPDSPSLEFTSPRKAPKRPKTDEPSRQREQVPIPDAESFPAVDAGEENNKPPYTYAQMIALAIWKAPSRRRTLSQIYDFIRKTWCYYQKDDTWENSIRHNLSLHKKFFEKQARAKDDPGKGNYWLIIPGNERELLDVYLKERSGAETAVIGKNLSVASTTRPEPSPLPPALSQSFQEPMLPPQLPNFHAHLPPTPTMPPPAHVQPELSSDATIPASDLAFEETELTTEHQQDFSALDAALSSSPPSISGHDPVPSDTPTRARRIGGSSGRTSGKRKRYSMVDSGYMTGLESSILRYGQQRAPVFSSEADIHHFQGGGRAEDAIRKLRASSPISPSKARPRLPPPSSSPVGKESPLRYRASPSKQLMLTKTPANSKKSQLMAAPSLPPPKTTSKYNTSPIRQHDKLRANVREMLETPQCIRDYNSKYSSRRGKAAFAIWEDDTSGPELESPLANSAGRMLDEILSEKRNQKTPAASPFKSISPIKSFPLFPPVDENAVWNVETPSKPLSSPSKYLPPGSKMPDYDAENWIITEEVNSLDTTIDLAHFGSDDSDALDLTQTFRGIGEMPTSLEAYGPATLHRFG
ncbi:hypothetical protein VPNG_00948 [Cytospora leucostoma]|uniref:Fork-head domain-containing protein n=1 Tax=Cytospora leucostoma TaxID=1230097 RepID=A0A423XMI1_9PEZI|nr:hypothetical protein VPNG_00948 [Cytospora leucostoma]